MAKIRFFYTFLLLLAVQLAVAQNGLQQYEYWLDNDYANREVAVGSSVPEILTIDISQLSFGLHYFNFRAKSVSGQWGALSRYMVYLSNSGSESTSMTDYEYWLDNDYANRKVMANTAVPEAITMDISRLSPGVHYFNFRAKTNGAQWGGLSRYMIYIQNRGASNHQVEKVEFWIDENSENRLSQEVENDSVVITMDLSDMELGVHTFNVQCQTASGEWTVPTSYEFTIGALPTVPTPVIIHEGNIVTITDGEGVDDDYPITYYYTQDGTQPTENSMRYEAPIEVTRNMIIRAVGVQYAHNRSAVAELNVDWFKVATPTFVQHGNMLTISCDTTRAAIYYTIGGGEEQVYTNPIRLVDASVVMAVGKVDGYYDSEEAIYQPRMVKSIMPTVSYNGRKVRLATDEEGAVLYYTLDGTSPADGLDRSAHAIEYGGEFNVENLCLLRAVAVVDTLNVSDVNDYSIDYLFNGETAYVSQGNLLAKAFEWCGGMDAIERLAVEGPLSNTDMELLKNAQSLAYLDLSKVTLTSNRMPDDAFNGAKLVSFVSPSGFSSTGGQLFANCPQLAAVVWNADVELNANTFDGVDNPNLLLYVNNATYAPLSVPNVVVNGVIDDIVLTDKDAGNNNFYCPQAFTANSISYTRNFRMQTEVGISRGWETITLPFTVQTITHERNGQLQPFMAAGNGKSFWLLQMSASGLEAATEIVANQPYVISMPNSVAYFDEYNLAGHVTFTANNVMIESTELNGVEGLGVVLMPAFQSVARSADVFAINRNAAYGTYAEGSVFVADYREVRPFEAYTLHPAGRHSVISLNDLINGSSTDVLTWPLKDEADDVVKVYTLAGTLVTTGKYREVVKQLHKGVYMINGTKIVIK